MSTIIRFKRKLSGGNEGITLLPGEPFFNVKDKKFYIGNENGKLQDVVGITINTAEDNVVDFNVGVDHYRKTINNVAHSTEADKLTSKNIGGSEVPVYFDGEGKPVACTLPEADINKYGLVQLGYEKPEDETNNYRPVAKDKNGKLYVYVAGPVEGVATSADKLTTSAGSDTQPVYFNNGIPTVTSYELKKTVPADAKFTDTTYEYATNTTPGLVTLGPFEKNEQDSDSLPLMKSNTKNNVAYVDISSVNTRIKNCEDLLTWETF